MKNSKSLSVVLSVVLSVLGVVLLTQAATTISTDITTGGNLTVTTGKTTLVNASTTRVTISTGLWVNGYATTTSAGAVSMQGNLAVVGNSTLTGTLGVTGKSTLVNASTTRVTISTALWINGYATTSSNGNISTKGTLNVSRLATMVDASTTKVSISGSLWINGYATTTSTGAISTKKSMQVGGAGTVFTKMIGDYCTIATKTITASTTGYMNCTPRTTGLVAAGDPVMVMATSSLDKNFHIIQASSSAADVIGLAVYNSGEDFSVNKATGQRSLNFLIMSAQ